jgi:hypothetical protein
VAFLHFEMGSLRTFLAKNSSNKEISKCKNREAMKMLSKKGVLGLISITTFCLVVGGLIFITLSERVTHKFLLPKGFTGWVKVVFEQPEYPALKQEQNYLLYEVPSSGTIMTSSKNYSGPVVFYYVEADGQITDFPSIEGVIHGGGTSSGEIWKPDGTTEIIPQTYTFFVGTEEQYRNQPFSRN